MHLRNLLLTLGLLALLLAAPAARAELVIFTHGGFTKVKGYALEGDQVRLELRSGEMRVPLLSVARILEDELEDAPVEVPESVGEEFDPYFREGQAAPATPHGELIFEAARRHSLNPDLVAAVVRAESAFNSRAVSVKGARGLMQLMPATGLRFGLSPESAFEPGLNLDAGSRYLRWLVDRFEGRLGLALAAYNAGEGTVDRYGGVPPYGETRRYLKRIYNYLDLPTDGLPSS
jgi:soluble lytic murein transglycosylase-like protein